MCSRTGVRSAIFSNPRLASHYLRLFQHAAGIAVEKRLSWRDGVLWAARNMFMYLMYAALFLDSRALPRTALDFFDGLPGLLLKRASGDSVAGELPLEVSLWMPYNLVKSKDIVMAEAAVTSKGQITIPVEIRQRMGLKERDRVIFTLLSNGTTVMRAKNRSITEMAGTLKGRGKRVSIKDMRMD